MLEVVKWSYVLIWGLIIISVSILLIRDIIKK